MKERLGLAFAVCFIALLGFSAMVTPWAAMWWGKPAEGLVIDARVPRRTHACVVSVQFQAWDGYAPTHEVMASPSICDTFWKGSRVRLRWIGKGAAWVVLEEDGGFRRDNVFLGLFGLGGMAFILLFLRSDPRLFLFLLLLLPQAAMAQEKDGEDDDRPGVEAEADDEEEEEPGHNLEVGLRGSRGREANTRDWDIGPTLTYGLLTSRDTAASRFRYELEASYNDASTKLDGDETNQSTRVRTVEFRYAKLSVLELFGFDLKKRIGFVPYAAGGVQRVDSFQTSTSFDEDQEAFVTESTREVYWAPSWGVGGEVALNKRVSLAIDYNQNTARFDRRIYRFSFELKVAVLGRRDD